MADVAKRRVAPLLENMTESATACLLTMVQGNVLALGVGHWLIASRTGLLAGLVATVAVLLSRTSNRWIVAAVLALATGLVDYVIHPGQFGAVATEAIVTGAGAGALSLAVGSVRRRLKNRAAAP